MTEEEFKKLPSCIRYKNPEKKCSKLNDDWDELEDPCEYCYGYKYFARNYLSGFMTQSFKHVINNIE